ncbi:S8 family serine peptidase [Nocardioides euryhalodurans]|uniref:Peptidase S8 n=1 Tax=Nocardioides euryhalodurans TaxID=2518370 RepID=A0A4P7GLD5_9ACTN|nr:S8 family serine peptidase [Nocardioides euryhalodurans]QBR92915.1 peptidase S8 [Nocardioides euryhalodurans]
MNADSPNHYRFLPHGRGSAESTSMDPRLQRLVAMRRLGRSKPSTASTDENEVAVIAKVASVEAFEALSEVTPGVRLGDVAEDGTTIVTARVPVARIDAVRAQEGVVSLKPAQRLRPALAATTAEIGARPEDLPAGTPRGDGVVVGVIDFGCDFAHENFLRDGGGTRLLRLWDQNGSGNGSPGFAYGDVHATAAIDTALATPNPYVALGYRPGPRSHGTHVMDIAAGNGRGTGAPGVAPQADLVFVEVASSDIPWGGAEAVGASFGDSVQLLEALAFVFESAGSSPCVVNVSLGTNGGPHDGTTLVEQGIDRLLTQAPDRAVCIAASNAFADGIHAAGTVSATAPLELAWVVADQDQTDNELELWAPGASRLSVDLVAPGGQVVGTLGPGESGSVTREGELVLFAANRLDDPNNHDNTIGVFLSPKVPVGRWVLRLTSLSGDDVPFHAWIERDDNGPSTFEEPLDNTHTIGSISCGQKSIVVGSYDAHKPAAPISWFSSAGPTRDGREKPEVSAPGHDVVAASSTTGTGTTRKSGTSMASPAVAGCVAVLLAEAARRQRQLDVDEIRSIVAASCRPDPPVAGAWDDRYGAGRVSLAAMVKALAGP